jgi:hypothetical protein
MTWTYDSGLPSPIRTLIRNAVIAKLHPLTRAGGGWLEAVIPIGFLIKGPHDELGIDLLWQELGGRAPLRRPASNRTMMAPRTPAAVSHVGLRQSRVPVRYPRSTRS